MEESCGSSPGCRESDGAVVNAEGKFALEEEEVRKGEARLLALKKEVNHSTTPPPTVPADFVQELRCKSSSARGTS